MEISAYWRLLRARWWLPVLGLVVGVVASGVLWTTVVDRDFRSCSRLFVAAEAGSGVSDAIQSNAFAQQRLVTYSGLATSRQVAQRAIDELGLEASAGSISRRVTATSEPGSVLLDVCATDPTARGARALATEITTQLTEVVAALETPVRGGSPAAGARVVDVPGLPSAPSGVALAPALVAGGLLGVAAAIVLAVGLGVADRRIRSGDDVESTTGLPVLTGLPRDPARPDTAVIVLDQPSPLLQSVQTLAALLGASRQPAAVGVVAVVSPGRGEGRTTVAIDLAAALADLGHTVALVGADLDSADLDERLGATDAPGLSSVLSGSATLPDVLRTDLVDGVTVVPTGSDAAPGHLLGSDAFGEVLTQLRADHHAVVVDTAAADSSVDSTLVAGWSDAVLILARAGRTRRPAVRRTVSILARLDAPVAGLVLTFDGRGRR